MHTPEQAKALWCPMVRHSTESAAHGFNRGCTDAMLLNKESADDDRFTCTCVADACAMWRWAAAQREEPIPPEDLKGIDRVAWLATQAHKPPVKSQFGYCGLAGRPEAW